jgi:hypothetical protein
MASDQFYLFTALAAFNSAVQAQLRQVASPEDIVAIAAEYGFAITLQQLNFFRRDSAPTIGSGQTKATPGERISSQASANWTC